MKKKGFYRKFRNRLGNIKYIHRVKMEKKLGRRLKKNERVHHRDLDKSNNRLSNLTIKDNKKHTKKHYHNGDYHRLTKAEMRKGAITTNKILAKRRREELIRKKKYRNRKKK